MNFKELKEKSRKDLENLLAEERAELVNLKFEVAAGNLKNVRKFRDTKKNIARILTMMGRQ